MKYAIVVPEGAADEPLSRLNNKSPLEAAETPNIDWISMTGRQGNVKTIPAGMKPASEVALLSLLGYNPGAHHVARGPLECIAQGLAISKDETAFVCSFVTFEGGRLVDCNAGRISQGEGATLISALNEALEGHGYRFHSGPPHGCIMTTRAIDAIDLECTPPHDIPDQPVADYLPVGPDAGWVRDIMRDAGAILAKHDVNLVRADLGENPATDIWLWGQGKKQALPKFSELYRKSGALISSTGFVRAIGQSMGLELIDCSNASECPGIDYAAMGKKVVAAIDAFDLVVVHAGTPDQAGLDGDAGAKVEAIERIDERIVGPLLERLRGEDAWRILISPALTTPVSSRVHAIDPAPFCFAGTAVTTVLNRPFCERNAAQSDLQINPGHELMEYFLRP